MGVLLNDVDEIFSGELCYYPGSHFALSDYLTTNGFDSLFTLGASALPNGFGTDDYFYRPPVNCIGKKGDVFILNYMTAHLVAPNTSPYIRYAVYFRISVPGYPQNNSFSAESPPPQMLAPWVKWRSLDHIIL